MYKPGALAVILGAFIAIFLLMPLLAVIPVSFTPARFLSMPNGNWSLRHYETLVSDPAWWQAAWLSIRIAVLSSFIATALSLAFALGIWMFRPVIASLTSTAGRAIGAAMLARMEPGTPPPPVALNADPEMMRYAWRWRQARRRVRPRRCR